MFFIINRKKKKKPHDPKQDIIRAHELFILNYGNHYFMKRNGEYDEYKQYNIPTEVEEEWREIIKDQLMDKLMRGTEDWEVANLARLKVNESEILDCFQKLAKSSNANKIRNTFIKMEPLIPTEIYDKVKRILTQ